MSTFKGGQDNPHRKLKIKIGYAKKAHPDLSFQCFEQRHIECKGISDFLKLETVCECPCHKRKKETK